jgi:hypothetical protein
VDSDLRNDEGGFFARNNPAFINDDEDDDEATPVAPFKGLKQIDSVKHTPLTEIKDRRINKAFPYTSKLLDFMAGENERNLTSYSLVDQDSLRGDDGKKKKKGLKKEKSETRKKAENMLFAPRFRPAGDDLRSGQDRNCLSDNDVADEDDLADAEPDSVMSDLEGVASPRLIPVRRTERTVSVNALHSPRSDHDTDWVIEDCELDEQHNMPDGPKVLAGAKGAQQLRGQSASRR